MPSNCVHPWFKTAYRRGVIDMHITDHDERFMASFDPDTYVSMLRRAKVQSVVMYAHSHVGLCYYPTRIGIMHKGLLGRDILADLKSVSLVPDETPLPFGVERDGVKFDVPEIDTLRMIVIEYE